MSALRSEKIVRFAPVVVSSASGPLNPLAFEELKDFWYSPRELMEFKQQARASPGERGMEYATPQRQKHRILTIRCTLSAARNGLSDEALGSIARKCTQWSGELAFTQACHDFATVYDPKLLSVIPSIKGSQPNEQFQFPFPFTVKRRVSSCGSQPDCRRVRQRRVL